MFLVYVALLCTMDLSSNLVRALIVGLFLLYSRVSDDLSMFVLFKAWFQLVAYLITSSSIGLDPNQASQCTCRLLLGFRCICGSIFDGLIVG